MNFKVSVFGLGKAGLPLAVVIADAGIPVVGVDVNPKVVDLVNSGKAPFGGEPGLEQLLQKHKGKNLRATTDAAEAVKECNAHIVIVPLFIDDKKQCDFSILDSAFTNIGKSLKKEDIVVLETTVPPKTTETRIRRLLEKGSGLSAGKDFYLAYSPERIMTGYSISRFRDFPKVLGGIDEGSTEKAFGLYSLFCNKVEKVNDSKTAEMVKVAEGVYRDVNIALANELLRVCDRYGVDFWEMRAKANHEFCHIHEPGSVGGHCIPIYPWFLINETEVPLISLARKSNDDMLVYYLEKVKEISPSGKVGVIGLAYRSGVKENNFSRSVPFIRLLKAAGYDVYGRDSSYSDAEIRSVFGVEPLADFKKMDVVVIFNKVTEYNDSLKGMEKKILDVKNSLGND